MKILRILLLLAVAVMLAAVVSDYVATQRAGSAGAVTEPEEIPRNLDSKASRWTWSQSSANERKVEIHADTVEQIRDTTLLQLKGVELLIYRPDSQSYDRIVCSSARFDGETLYSEDEVTVLLGLVSENAARAGQPTTIRSTGVTFQSKTGVASTDRYTEYEFEGGRGHSTGSFYDSVNRYFRMNSQAYVERYASTPGQPPLKIRAGELTYFEIDQRIDLKNGASLERGSQRLESAEAMVQLDSGIIRKITARVARGADQQAARVVRFETPLMEAIYSPQQILESIHGQGESVMTSESGSSILQARGNRIDLRYETPPGAEESMLRDMHVRDSAVLEVRPAPGSPPENGRIRRVSSEILHLKMDAAAENVEAVETLARGRLELLPRGSQDSRDVLEAERMTMFYAAGNRMERLQATGDVALERQPGAARDNPGKQAAPLRTRSGGLLGEFDPASGEMRTLRQWADFHFEQGEQSGRAEEAQFDLATNRIELRNRAEVWDPDSRTSADQLTLDQESGDFLARGRVASVYHEKAASAAVDRAAAQANQDGELFSTAEPVYATAERMVSKQRSGLLEYHGKARLWQGADRIDAEQIHIARREKKLTARENVVSVIGRKDEDSPQEKSSGAARRESPIEVRADAMQYAEAARLIEYDGRVELTRGAVLVKAQEIDAWLAAPGSAGKRLEKAAARGAVEILETVGNDAAGRSGFGQRADYYPAEEKVVLEGEPARVVNASRDTTQGAALTYYLNDDRLLVLGSPQQRSYSLRRQRQQP